MHAVIVDADGAIRVVVLEYQIVTADLSNDLEVGPTAVLAFWIGIGDLLDLGF